MPNFTYKALDAQGKEVTGTLTTDSVQSAIKDLQSKGYIPVKVIESQDGGTSGITSKIPLKITSKKAPKKKKIKLPVLVNFVQQLATLLGAGASLLDSLVLIGKQTYDPLLKSVLEEMITNIKQGDSLSEAMRKQKMVFPSTMVNMVAAGEASGNLERVLDRYGEFIQRQEEFVKRTKTMLIYPSFVMGFGVLVVIALMIFVIPNFVKMFEDMKENIPLPTKILMAFSDFVTAGILRWIVLASVTGLITAIILYIKSPTGKMKWDQIKLKIPIMGQLSFKIMLARYATTIGTLIGSGVSIIPALSAAKDTIENIIIREETERIIHQIERGGSLGNSMEEGNVFPPLMVQVVKIGEEVGKLEELLEKVGNYYDKEAETSSSRMLALLEPLIIIVMGTVVGMMVISIILPIIKSASVIK